MIQFNYETDFELPDEERIRHWIGACIRGEGFEEGTLNYVFCDDDYLLRLNIEFLKHDTLTDIISFDYTMGKEVSGDIFISVERVRENAKKFSQSIDNEMNRVMVHGILHFMGFTDKTDAEKTIMRSKEEKSLGLLK